MPENRVWTYTQTYTFGMSLWILRPRQHMFSRTSFFHGRCVFGSYVLSGSQSFMCVTVSSGSSTSGASCLTVTDCHTGCHGDAASFWSTSTRPVHRSSRTAGENGCEPGFTSQRPSHATTARTKTTIANNRHQLLEYCFSISIVIQAQHPLATSLGNPSCLFPRRLDPLRSCKSFQPQS